MNKAMIDPKNPSTVGTSAWNLGNHVLIHMFYTLYGIRSMGVINSKHELKEKLLNNKETLI